ncbi:MAG: flagellar hook-associated protein FlgL [Ilumatobacteraceae bacterium]
MRISNLSQSLQTKRNIYSLQNRIAEGQLRLSTGTRIQRASDDPTAALEGLRISRELRHLDSFQRNISDAQTWLSLADGALQQTNDITIRARNLFIQADSGVLGQDERDAIASELDELAAAVADTANMTRAGHPIFGGTSSSSSPFAADGSHSGNSDEISRQVSTGVNIVVNLNGEETFGTYDAADPAQGNLMQVIKQAATDIRAGADAGQHLNRLDELTQGIHSAIAKVGARQQAVEQHEERLLDRRTQLQAQRSTVLDTDIAEELLELRQNEVAYQAALGVSARVLSTSILDFLR